MVSPSFLKTKLLLGFRCSKTKWIGLVGIAIVLAFALGVWFGRHRAPSFVGIRQLPNDVIERPETVGPSPNPLQETAAAIAPVPENWPDYTSDLLHAGQSTSNLQFSPPYESSADFAKFAMKSREQALKKLKVEPHVFIPINPRPATAQFPWKTNIVTTVFWIGEKQSFKSAWDANWTNNYGGFDNPEPSARRNYIPVGFTPRQNPFYCALPYNDVTHGQFKPEAPLVIPWFKQAYTEPGRSVCQHRWIAIRKGNRICYAQWEDCGPFRTDHFQYVFQGERPTPSPVHGAGLSVSPAVRDYLGLQPIDVTDWQFVDVRDVQHGPWQTYGENNHFVIARRLLEQREHEKRP